MRLSLRNRLALFFFVTTLVSIGALYLYVAPGLRGRLIDDRLRQMAADAAQDSGPIAAAMRDGLALSVLRARVDAASLASGERVTVLVPGRGGPGAGLPPLADSSRPEASLPLTFVTAHRAVTGSRPVTGTEAAASGPVAEAARPLLTRRREDAVIVFSSPISDITRTVTVVRREILVAGALAIALALTGGYVVARALARRVKRLELAAGQVAAGDFRHPIIVDSGDELGQLAVAFNAMQRQLEQLDLARKKFIATASHELRTPIFSLGGFVELLEDEELDRETRARFLEQVRQQVERLRKLSVDLLDLSRLESGSLELRPEPVDLAELARAVSGEFEPSLAQHGTRLELRLATRQMEAQCDPVRVAQIIRILIDNALTHTPSGTLVTVTAARANGLVRLAVRDDGPGIDPDALPRIFEPFYTADDAQGSGLGLAIASELAERMDGHLSVVSHPGTTTFTLEMPA